MNQNKNTITRYEWKGLNRAGEKMQGIIEARSLVRAKVELHKQGIIPKKVIKKRNAFFNKKNKKISSAHIAVFCRQLATLIAAGIPIIQAFDIVSKSQDNEKMRQLIYSIKSDVETGLSLAESLQKQTNYFNALFCNLVDAGEKSGSLEIMLNKVAAYKEKVERIKKKVKKALTYPIAVLIVAFLVTAGLLIFVVPQFQSLFNGFGASLPAITQGVVTLSTMFRSYWYIIFIGLGSLGYAFIYAQSHSPQFAQQVDRILLKCPLIGAIFEKAAVARFTRTLSITFAAGLPLVTALKSVAGATGNILYAQATDKIREDVATGQQLQMAMGNTGLFPNMAIQMVAIGEESGTLEQMLSKVADFYEEEVDNAIEALSSLLEPLIMLILGVLVGGLVIAMYLPIFKLGSVV